MSYTTMLGFRDCWTVELDEFRNSHGSAPRVWDSIISSYGGPQKWILASDEELRAFWRLAKDPRLSRAERVAFAWTFDRAVCFQERAEELAELLMEFDRAHPAVTGNVNHLPAVAAALTKPRDEGFLVFGWNQTSVADTWTVEGICEEPFHARPVEGFCPECGNPWEDRRFGRLFSWGKDRGREPWFDIFELAKQEHKRGTS